MGRVLTSWKDISQYVGKGVRTLQRWERTIGFPVRRPDTKLRHSVFALTDEIDLWLKAQSPPDRWDLKAENEALRKENNELLMEVEMLRQELEARLPSQRPAKPEIDTMELFARCELLIRRSKETRLRTAEAIDMTINLFAIYRRSLMRTRRARESPRALQ